MSAPALSLPRWYTSSNIVITCTGPCLAIRKPLCTHARRQQCTVVCSFPNFNKPLNFDATMLWGDGVMICATELASDRIPLEEAGILSGIMLGIWAVVRSPRNAPPTNSH